LTASRIRWAIFAALYAAFYVWYGGSGDPISPEEAKQYSARFAERAAEQGGNPPDADSSNVDIAANLSRFIAEDDGKQFVMLNLNVYRDAPAYSGEVDGSDGIESAAAAQDEYQRRIVPLLFKRAIHPLAAVEPAQLLGGTGDFERQDWSYVSMVRYRSRRDFLEFILEPAFARDVNHKWAALGRSTAMITVPETNFTTVRLVPALILIVLGLVLDRLGAHSARKKA
jgi:hypothetical protein